MAFLRTILIILLVYYLLKILAKIVAPKIFSYAAKKAESHFRDTFDGFAQQNHRQEQKVGDVYVGKNQPKKKANTEKVGEYIDFEEVD